MDRYLEFAANHTLLVAALLFSFFLLVFTELKRKASGAVNVEPQDAVRLINNDAIVLDLRSPEAFAKGHIVNAKNIPFDELDAKNEKIAGFRAKPIVAVCESGMTSARAADKLRKSGFESVYGLKGGINGWTQASLPLVTARKSKKKT
jgi:rhodanese-related sulfurtransferase